MDVIFPTLKRRTRQIIGRREPCGLSKFLETIVKLPLSSSRMMTVCHPLRGPISFGSIWNLRSRNDGYASQRHTRTHDKRRFLRKSLGKRDREWQSKPHKKITRVRSIRILW
jgi:hypothetical protein